MKSVIFKTEDRNEVDDFKKLKIAMKSMIFKMEDQNVVDDFYLKKLRLKNSRLFF
jgi:hypothetical protein